LTFAVKDSIPIIDVLEDWSRKLEREFDAVQLFDLLGGDTIYRVFLLPGCLQFDLSFTPAPKFGAAGPKFRLLFGYAYTMRCERVFAMNEGDIGKPSIGSVLHAIMR
jgi:hypothetical protein